MSFGNRITQSYPDEHTLHSLKMKQLKDIYNDEANIDFSKTALFLSTRIRGILLRICGLSSQMLGGNVVTLAIGLGLNRVRRQDRGHLRIAAPGATSATSGVGVLVEFLIHLVRR